jgi:hypothetical protein
VPGGSRARRALRARDAAASAGARWAWTLAVLSALGSVACTARLTEEQLKDPATCEGCHAEIYREWSGSMHAYAGDDPIFRAMNAYGQAQTNGALGDLCVRCHAPLALREGLTVDGTNLDEVPASRRGVTCYFCHQVDRVTGTHNAAMELAGDAVMRGGRADPLETPAHDSAYSSLHDRDQLESSSLCGACHDIVNGQGFALERTYKEWQGSLYSNPSGRERLSCQSCHMPSRVGLAANVEGAPERRVRGHMFPGVDLALIDWPEREAQRAAVQRELDATLLASLCVVPGAAGATVSVDLEAVATGHHFPSGAAPDRRLWIELVAYQRGRVVFQSGVVPDRRPVPSIADPHLVLYRDRTFRADGTEAKQLFEVVRAEPNVLLAPVTREPTDPRFGETHSVTRFPIPTLPDRVTLRVRLEPIGREILDELVQAGYLDLALADAMPRLTLGSASLEWTADSGELCQPIRR